jgi:conjugative transfer pilus assembly protein TraH
MRQRMRKIIASVMFFTMSFYSTFSFAAVDNFGSSLKSLGISSNINKPGVVNDQLGGFMTGGSLHTRNKVSNVQFLNIQPPSMNIGCGGIDLFAGGLGYINGEMFKRLITDIGTAGISYASMLAIKTISPQVADLISELEAMARFMNAQNMNSCQLGASIASGAWPKNAASQDLACQARKMGTSAAANYFIARYNCSGNDNVVKTNAQDMEGLLGTDYNLVWAAFEKAGAKSASSLSNEDVEELMSISGTLIAQTKDNKRVTFEHKNSLVKSAKIIETLIYGNYDTLSVYKCKDHNKCLDLDVKDKTFDKDNSYLVKITKIVNSIADKFIQENKTGTSAGLEPEEENLVTTSSIPILKIIELETGLKGHGVSLAVEEYAEVIAYDYIINYLDSMIDLVYKAVTNLEYAQIDGEAIDSFKKEIRYVKTLLINERGQAFERMNTLLSVKQRMIQVEHMLKNAFGEYRYMKT